MAGNASAGADRVLGALPDREIASALGFTRLDAEVTTGGLLMFGKAEAIRRFLPTHEAAFQVLRGLDVEVNDFLPYPLLKLAEEMLSWFRARNSEDGQLRAAPRGRLGLLGDCLPGGPGERTGPPRLHTARGRARAVERRPA